MNMDYWKQMCEERAGNPNNPVYAETYKCPICKDLGQVIADYEEDGTPLWTHCVCVNKNLSLRRLEASGMANLARRYTFDNFKVSLPHQQYMFDTANKYMRESPLPWLYIGGQPGTGKTHICTAIVTDLINRGYRAEYLIWRNVAAELNAMMNTPEYGVKMRKYQTVPLLYIDDFLKGSASQGDINKAFEIINSRYCNSLPTIISSERPLKEVISLDEALGSRIAERAKGYNITIAHGLRKNIRLRG